MDQRQRKQRKNKETDTKAVMFQGINYKAFPQDVSSILGNSKAHKFKWNMFFFLKFVKIRNRKSYIKLLKNVFFEIKKFLKQIIISRKIRLVKKPMLPLPRSILSSVNDPVLEMWAKPLSEFSTRYHGDINMANLKS